MAYRTVVGIEIHLELKTKTKMFSAAPYAFKDEANTDINEIDLAFPGTLPCLNRQAVKEALEACLALHLTIDPLLRFDRKNYFYSDLPKGYQITQQFHPLGRNGYLTINVQGENKRIRINRIHLEEDTAKQFHLRNETLIDFNRAGVPLIEIVSEPDLTSGLEAALYVEKLRETFSYLGVSDVKMEEGSMRCDVNVSLCPSDSAILGTKVEIKNLNSIKNIEVAIDYEVARQKELLEKGEAVVQETRRFDEKSLTTVTMRKKEGSVDYKYFPEPNIFPVRLDQKTIAAIAAAMPELPDERFKRYTAQYALSNYDAEQLIQNKDLAYYFDKLLQDVKNPKLACNLLLSELQGLLAKRNEDITTTKVQPADFSTLVNMTASGAISSKQAKTVLAAMLDGEKPQAIVKKHGFKQVSDPQAIKTLIDEVLAVNQNSIKDYRKGKDHALGFLVGQVMKKSHGQANPKLVADLLKEALHEA